MTEFIISGASFLVTAATAVIAAIKGKKNKTKAQKQNQLVSLAKIVQKIPSYISEAEEALGAGTGKAKLRYVLRELEIECLKVGIEFVEEQFKGEIESILKTPQKKTEMQKFKEINEQEKKAEQERL